MAFHQAFLLSLGMANLVAIPGNALLCAFGCRELPAQQIVSSAQFRSFIMPRDVRLHGCIGCCGACGGGGDESAEESNNGESATDKGTNARTAGIVVGMNPQMESAEVKKDHSPPPAVWYSSPGSGRWRRTLH